MNSKKDSVTFNYLVAVKLLVWGWQKGSRGYKEEITVCDNLLVNWCVSLRAVTELRKEQTGIPPVHVLLGEGENAGARIKTRKLIDLKVQNRLLQ